MRNIFRFHIVVLASAALFACAKSSSDLRATAYGEKLSDAAAVPIADILAPAGKYDGQRVKVEGLVTAVCPKRGCWIKIAQPQGKGTLRFKVPDGKMVFPMSSAGKTALAEGTVRRIELSLKQSIAYLKHEAEERGESFDPKSVRKPVSFVQLDGVGAELRDSR